jgi:Transposase DNA-binding/Transposase DDE domain
MIRTGKDVLEQRAPLVAEMAAADLGDERLNARRNRVIAVLEQRPDAGFPEVCANESEAEALYRFFRNRRVTWEGILAPHLTATRARCGALDDQVLVVHDTTEISFTGDHPRAGLTALGARRQGFWLHAALAVSAEGLRAPLGVVAVAPFTRPPRPAAAPRPAWRERFADPAKESRRWAAGVAALRPQFGDASRIIHLMDREGDSYELFAALQAQQDRFVIRLAHNRRVVPDVPTADPPTHLTEAVPRTDALFEREVDLPPRRADPRPRTQARHPAREARRTTLRFAARRVTLRRPPDLPASLPATLTLNVVVGWEVRPPSGAEPVEWRLITTEPIDTVAQVAQIVDWYRTRWLIEEFFKALKTGCAYEKRQLESLDTLLVALALLIPIAWQLLLLRSLARDAHDAPATVVLSPRQLAVLRASAPGARLPVRPTIRDALLVIARLGGHLRHNGEPGWLVLARGMQTLLVMEAGWAAAQQASTYDQS